MASPSSTLPTVAAPSTLNLHFSPEWMRTNAGSSSLSPAAISRLPATPSALISPQGTHGMHPNGLESLSATSGSMGIGTAPMTPAPSGLQHAPGSSSNVPQTLPYSALLTPASTTNPMSKPLSNVSTDTEPFRYSRDTFLSIWRAGTIANGGPGWRLGIEVEHYDGVVVDTENAPACAKEMTDAELKLYATTSLNSRRSSLSHAHSHANRDGEPVGLGILGRRGTGGEGMSMALPSSSRGNSLGAAGPTSPLRERFSRRDSSGTTQPYRPRQLVNNATATTPGMDGTPPLVSPRTTSGGFGFGGGPGFDGVLSAGEGWGGRRRGPAGALAGVTARQGSFLRDIQEKAGDRELDTGANHRTDNEGSQDPPPSGEERADGALVNGDAFRGGMADNLTGKLTSEEPAFENWEDDPEIANTDTNGVAVSTNGQESNANPVNGTPAHKSPPNPAEVKWQYVDDKEVTQGPFAPEDLTVWENSGWLRPDLRMNRPDYDTLFLPLSTWKSKMNKIEKRDGEDKGIFFTWFEPVVETKPPLELTKVVQPPPGLARHDTQSLQNQANAAAPIQKTSELTTPVPPSVFEVLRRADHAPSPVFGEGGFSHSPVSSHRLSMKGSGAALESTHASSPASSTANIYGETEFTGVMRQPNPAGVSHQGMSYVPHNPLPNSFVRGISSANNVSPLVGYSSPIAGSYSAGLGAAPGELVSLGMQPPYPSSPPGTMFTNAGMRKLPYEQYPTPNIPWQGGVQSHGLNHRGSSLVSGMAGGGMAPTSSTTSSLSNVPRAHFGGRRSPSPAAGFSTGNANGGLTSSLGGEVYEGTLGGSAFHTTIGRMAAGGTGVASGSGYSPQQQFGTLYRSPVPPIPETSPTIGTVAGSGPAPGAQQPNANDASYHTASYGQGPLTTTNDPPVTLLRRPSLEPMEALWTALQQQHLHQQQEQRSRLQPLDMQSDLLDGMHTQPSTEGMNMAKEDKVQQRGGIAAEVVSIARTKLSPMEHAPAPKDEEDDNSQPFIPVKKQQRAPAQAVAERSPAPLPSASISNSTLSPSISQSSSKMTVPLASLITNPTSALSVNPPPAPAKAWATVAVKDEAKGLKEIQEAETKRAKENEKLKSKPSPVVSPGGVGSTKDEEVGTLLTWGLPTSLAGARAGKDATTSNTTTTPPAAVWTGSGTAKAAGANAGNGKKTTMKDIQEEEEKRRKKEKELFTAAKRVGEKAPAPASVSVSAVNSGAGSVWSTVGPSGKATRPSTGGSTSTATGGSNSTAAPTGIAALPPRPSAAAIASSGMRAAHNNATAASSLGAVPAASQPARRSGPTNSAAVVAASNKGTGKGANTDEVGPAANVSADTLKWMRETLKGKLVKGITVDEVVGLVLMMNEEDDIADTIYQSSPTLPGKRFAAEFMEKRRGDRGLSGVSGAGANIAPSTRSAAVSAGSGAESVAGRLQPSASASQDAFGFKVVKKKGKGGKV